MYTCNVCLCVRVCVYARARACAHAFVYNIRRRIRWTQQRSEQLDRRLRPTFSNTFHESIVREKNSFIEQHYDVYVLNDRCTSKLLLIILSSKTRHHIVCMTSKPSITAPVYNRTPVDRITTYIISYRINNWNSTELLCVRGALVCTICSIRTEFMCAVTSYGIL